jgi:hypothetical protein
LRSDPPAYENDVAVLTYDLERDRLRIESKRGLVSLSILEAAAQARLVLSYSPITDHLTIGFDGGEHCISEAADNLKVVIKTDPKTKPPKRYARR